MDLSIAAAPQLPPMRRQPLTDLIRINVLIAERSGLSRRGADAAIAEGRVTSGGRSVVIGERLDPSVALELDGKVLVAAARTSLNGDEALGGVRLLAWYKPPGVTTTHSDPHAAVTLPQALAARARLESEGIPVLMKGEGDGPYRMGPMHLLVPEGLIVQARLVLEGDD